MIQIEGLLLNFTVFLAVALLCGSLTLRFFLSPIPGYLLAGIICGPFTPGLGTNVEIAQQMADIGVIFLMFGVGLHFNFQDLWKVRDVAVPGAIVQSLVATVIVSLFSRVIGMSLLQGIIIGLAFSVASTAVLAQMLSDYQRLTTPEGRLAMGWLVVEDFFTIVVLIALPVMALHTKAAGDPATLGREIAFSVGKLVLLAGFVVLMGARVVPWLFKNVFVSREMLNIAVPTLALVIAVISAEVFGVSLATGAFLAGMVVAQSVKTERVMETVMPIRDLFVTLFFMSVGMLVDPVYMVTHPGRLFFALLMIVVIKPLTALLLLKAFRQPLRLSLIVAIGLAQVGEFSFILIQQGHKLGMLPIEAGHQLIAAAMISIMINPLLFAKLDTIEKWLRRFAYFKHST
jgi:CPA2 family monovalent cation:H+ antiporter-2